MYCGYVSIFQISVLQFQLRVYEGEENNEHFSYHE
jgi:hypothetical protein